MYRSASISGWVILIMGWLLFGGGILFLLFGRLLSFITDSVFLSIMMAVPGLVLVAIGEGLRILVKIAENTKDMSDTFSKLRRRN